MSEEVIKLAERAIADPDSVTRDEILRLAKQIVDSVEPWSRAHYLVDDLMEGEAD